MNLNWIDEMVARKKAMINNCKLGTIMKALPNVSWTISGDYGYNCIKDYKNGREFRLLDNGRLLFLCGYNDRVGAWGDYTKEIEIKDLDALMAEPNWYNKLINCKKDNHSPNIIMI